MTGGPSSNPEEQHSSPPPHRSPQLDYFRHQLGSPHTPEHGYGDWELTLESYARAMQRGAYDKAADNACRLLANAGGLHDPADPRIGQSYLLLGRALVKDGQIERAEQVYRDALPSTEHHPIQAARCHLGLAHCLRRTQRFDGADRELEDALARAQRLEHSQCALRFECTVERAHLFLDTKQMPFARKWFEYAAQLAPKVEEHEQRELIPELIEVARFCGTLRLSEYAIKAYSAAVQWMERWGAPAGQRVQALHDLACCYRQAGNFCKAQDVCSRALHLAGPQTSVNLRAFVSLKRLEAELEATTLGPKAGLERIGPVLRAARETKSGLISREVTALVWDAVDFCLERYDLPLARKLLTDLAEDVLRRLPADVRAASSPDTARHGALEELLGRMCAPKRDAAQRFIKHLARCHDTLGDIFLMEARITDGGGPGLGRATLAYEAKRCFGRARFLLEALSAGQSREASVRRHLKAAALFEQYEDIDKALVENGAALDKLSPAPGLPPSLDFAHVCRQRSDLLTLAGRCENARKFSERALAIAREDDKLAVSPQIVPFVLSYARTVITTGEPLEGIKLLFLAVERLNGAGWGETGTMYRLLDVSAELLHRQGRIEAAEGLEERAADLRAQLVRRAFGRG